MVIYAIIQYIGFVDCSNETEYMNRLKGYYDLKLAIHVLQFLFLGHTGFRFPLAHYPILQASPSELYIDFWRIVKLLGLFGFRVAYVSMDGAQSNRNFMKMLLPSDARSMLVSNIYDSTQPNISIIMDYSHVIKKIRNNISKSGHSANHKDFWDISVKTLKLHQKLTQEHLFLNSQLKMRNKLAEEVVNEDMLHLMKEYQVALGANGKDLESTIELLGQTTILTKIFRDKRPISEYEYPRLKQLREVLDWFRKWERQIQESKGKTKTSV